MNSSIFSNQDMRGARLLPFESTPYGTGVRQTFPGIGPGEREIGGGLIQPFAMGSPTVDSVTGNLATVAPPRRPFSLVDMAAISSAAFAQTVQDKVPEVDCIIPRYPYWPVADPVQQEELLYWFADGGSLRKQRHLFAAGARRDAHHLASSIRRRRCGQSRRSDHRRFDGAAPLRHRARCAVGSLTESTSPRRRTPTPDFVQVFESTKYDDLMNGLIDANMNNGGPAMFKQTLNVLKNDNFDIPGGGTVDILWVYNTAVPNWVNC